jgi:hypothetical protein
MLAFMESLTSAAGSAQGPVNVAMLKKSQDLMKQQSAQLLEALPEPARAPSPPGVGGAVDLLA